MSGKEYAHPHVRRKVLAGEQKQPDLRRGASPTAVWPARWMLGLDHLLPPVLVYQFQEAARSSSRSRNAALRVVREAEG